MAKVNVSDLSRRRAEILTERGLDEAAQENFETAKELFRQATRLHESADAITYWAWMEHQLGNPVRAIRLCVRAIGLDPEFGNPYNDIGSYLVAMDRYEQAVPWFEKATEAKRYEPKQFPHINLGRIYFSERRYLRSLAEFKKALSYDPANPELEDAVELVKDVLSSNDEEDVAFALSP